MNKKHPVCSKKEICRFVRIVGGFVMIGSFNPKSPIFGLQQATPKLKTFTGWYASLYACLCRYHSSLNQLTLPHYHITFVSVFFFLFFFLPLSDHAVMDYIFFMACCNKFTYPPLTFAHFTSNPNENQ